eukprot:COSAG05_NODE_5205_length_1236_cov_2.136324_1_plen_47_part_10
MQTESLASKIACICLYLRAHACHLRNPAVQQATVEILDTEFPGHPPP